MASYHHFLSLATAPEIDCEWATECVIITERFEISSTRFPTMKRVRVRIVLYSLAALLCTQAHAKRVHSFIVVDMISGKILSHCNADTQCYPASLTKQMTLFLLFDALQKGRLHFHDQFPVSEHAARQIPSRIGVRPGEKLTVKTIIEALIVKSANDAAVVAAEGLCGSEAAFVARMNQMARAIGMQRTHFANPSGCPDPTQHSTARDMAILCRALSKRFSAFLPLFQLQSFRYKGRTYYTHNHLLNRFQGTTGMKTGYIAASGFNICTSVVRYDQMRRPYHLLAVVMGKDSEKERDKEVVALLEPIFLRCGAVFYSKKTPLFGKSPGIRLANGGGLAFQARQVRLMHSPIHTATGMNILLDQYLENRVPPAPAPNIAGYLRRLPVTARNPKPIASVRPF